ncbi:MAG TPA: sodium/solute symporter [Candidatus Brocadiia bacterium]|nr:sodium/solute symporter [Candidatus Brocadiia bacterium]
MNLAMICPLLLQAQPPRHAGHWIDYVIIISYIIGITIFGLAFGSHAKTTGDFFFGGRRFAWWLIGMSCVATTVGSYSFMKYSQQAYKHGFSSAQTYLNDWFLMPFFMFGWIPIIYFSRVTSVPEYFERRFNAKCRILATISILLYMIGYVGYNLFTLGKALEGMLGWRVMTGAIIVGCVCAIYVHFGGQTSVIMTDLVQGMILLIAGFLILVVGSIMLMDHGGFWANFPGPFRSAFLGVREPHSFPAAGVFWQDAMANGVAAYFMNQGMLMRYMSAKSNRDAKKAVLFVVFMLMPLAAVATSNAGWIGRAMVNAGMLSADSSAEHIFVIVSDKVGAAITASSGIIGFFGLMMAALIAALMSTIDSLINAVCAISVNDIYRPIVERRLHKDLPDRHYLAVARWTAIGATLVGIALVPIFMSYDNMYVAHGNFIATVTPPMAVCIMLGAFWRRFNAKAALATLVIGSACMVLTYVKTPLSDGTPFNTWLIDLVSHGVIPDPKKGHTYMRAFFGLVACGGIAFVVTMLTAPAPEEKTKGLVMGSIRDAMRKLKGGEPSEEIGEKLLLGVVAVDRPEGEKDLVKIHPDDLAKMKARPGDILYAADRRWWFGGARSAHLKAGEPGTCPGKVEIDRSYLQPGELNKQTHIVVEKIM